MGINNNSFGAAGEKTGSLAYKGVCIKNKYGASCNNCPNLSCPIRSTSDDNMQILANHSAMPDTSRKGNALCIDIGTTTIVMQLYLNGSPVNTVSALNRQKGFGADVISRIKASNDGHRAELMRLIRYQLSNMAKELTKEHKGITIDKAVIAANTAMVHLLMGYPCAGLSLYPFKPYNTDMISLPFGELAGGADINADTVIFPAVSAFVGGDIVSGLYLCDFDLSDKVNLFIDLGTNGEMAIGNKEKILTASAAAGPAFEGGRIKYGRASVEGAICGVDIAKHEIKTIAQKPPIGICGTGIIETVSELLTNGIMDKTGLLSKAYFDRGYEICEGIYFTQGDIREFQTAKSAVKTGIEILAKTFGTALSDIDTVYLAGGFGTALNIEKACIAGIIPSELLSKVKAVGNSSLGGAVKLAFSGGGYERIESIRGLCGEVWLANDEKFNELYIQNMNF